MRGEVTDGKNCPLTISVELPDFMGGGGLCLGGPLEEKHREMFEMGEHVYHTTIAQMLFSRNVVCLYSLSVLNAPPALLVHGHTSADQTQNDYSSNDPSNYCPDGGGRWWQRLI